MLYLILEILVLLVLAAILGMVIGWMLSALFGRDGVATETSLRRQLSMAQDEIALLRSPPEGEDPATVEPPPAAGAVETLQRQVDHLETALAACRAEAAEAEARCQNELATAEQRLEAAAAVLARTEAQLQHQELSKEAAESALSRSGLAADGDDAGEREDTAPAVSPGPETETGTSPPEQPEDTTGAATGPATPPESALAEAALAETAPAEPDTQPQTSADAETSAPETPGPEASGPEASGPEATETPPAAEARSPAPAPVSGQAAVRESDSAEVAARVASIDVGARPPELAAVLGAEEAAKPKDDLKKIKGVGPKIEMQLNEVGITRFAQVAAFTQDHVDWVNSYVAFKGRIERDGWIEQAGILAAGGETDFSQRAGASNKKAK